MSVTTSPVAPRPAAARVARAPMRTCVGCRRAAEKSTLLRLVERGGTVVVDEQAAGRGAYVCPRPECMRQALRKDGAPIARGLRRHSRQVAIDEDTLATAIARSRTTAPVVRE